MRNPFKRIRFFRRKPVGFPLGQHVPANAADHVALLKNHSESDRLFIKRKGFHQDAKLRIREKVTKSGKRIAKTGKLYESKNIGRLEDRGGLVWVDDQEE